MLVFPQTHVETLTSQDDYISRVFGIILGHESGTLMNRIGALKKIQKIQSPSAI